MNTMNHLLIIDDEPSTRKILEHFLSTDYKITLKSDGMEAMAWLEEGNETSLILADLNMPNLNGREFTKVLRSSNLFGDIPVIILSGSDQSKDRIECLNLGADDFMIKPFNPEEVKAKIRAILRRMNSLKKNIF
ncbi:response regulator [Emticicia sp. CRIBPO]|nr:response regulator [Emticicia sp. CRIBPO]